MTRRSEASGPIEKGYPGEEPSQPETSHGGRANRLRRASAWTALGLVAVTGAGGAWKILERPGGIEHIYPTAPNTQKTDNVVRIIDWNIDDQASGRYKQLSGLAKKYRADAIFLQEVDTQDAARLAKRMPSWHVVYAMADREQHFFEGGFGNVIMTRENPDNPEVTHFAGTSMLNSVVRTVAGLGEDITSDITGLNTSLANTKAGWQERRNAISETVQVISGGHTENLGLITGHITGAGNSDGGLHRQQLS